MFKFLTYNKFKMRKWKKLSPQNRLAVFQKLENIEAKINGRKPNTIIVENLIGASGAFYNVNQVIKLDYKFIYEEEFRFLGMYTLFHEGRKIWKDTLMLERIFRFIPCNLLKEMQTCMRLKD